MNLQQVFTIFLAGVFAIVILIYAFEPVTNPDISLEVRNFTVNNTYYPMAHTDVNSGSLTLYYFNNATFSIPSARYTQNTSHIKIYTNSTVSLSAYPNISAMSNYYYSYNYQKRADIWSVDFTFVAIIIFLIVCGFAAFSIIKSFQKK
jgi:hypothetical protein